MIHSREALAVLESGYWIAAGFIGSNPKTCKLDSSRYQTSSLAQVGPEQSTMEEEKTKEV